jgi:hypothetical protein
MRFEAENQAGLKKIRNEFAQMMEEIQANVTVPEV